MNSFDRLETAGPTQADAHINSRWLLCADWVQRKDALSKQTGAMLCAGHTTEVEVMLTKRQPLDQLQCHFEVQLLVKDADAQGWQQQGQQGAQSHALVRQALQMIHKIWDLHDALQDHQCRTWVMALVCTHA